MRWRNDGTIEFLGRIDHQVKIRGLRIELGEIEAVLADHAAVREAVVMARATPRGDTLVAFVVFHDDAEDVLGDDARALRQHLAQHLPDYMVPASFVGLDAMPLNPSGKADRKALAQHRLPEPGRSGADENAPPANATEAAIAAIWRDLLAVEQVGRDDDFFALGGHSVLATRAMAQVRATFGVEVPLRTLFAASTVAGLAAAVAVAQDADLPPLVPVDRDRPLPLSFAQERLWFVDRLTAGDTAYTLPLTIVRRGALDAAALERALARVIERHEVLRTVFVDDDGTPRQVVRAPRPTPAGTLLPHHDLSDRPRDSAWDEAVAHVRRAGAEPFDLAAGPLLRGRLFSLRDDEHLLFLCLHHIVVDGLSLTVLGRDLETAYRAERAGSDPAWTPLAVQYADFAVWQRSWLVGPVLAAQTRFWGEALGGAPALLDLPTDAPRDPARARAGSHVSHLPAALGQALAALGRDHGATRFMVMLAGFSALMARLASQDDVVLGSPAGGRRAAELEPLIGLFVNLLPLRLDHRAPHNARQLVAAARDVTLAALDHQDLPSSRSSSTSTCRAAWTTSPWSRWSSRAVSWSTTWPSGWPTMASTTTPARAPGAPPAWRPPTCASSSRRAPW